MLESQTVVHQMLFWQNQLIMKKSLKPEVCPPLPQVPRFCIFLFPDCGQFWGNFTVAVSIGGKRIFVIHFIISVLQLTRHSRSVEASTQQPVADSQPHRSQHNRSSLTAWSTSPSCFHLSGQSPSTLSPGLLARAHRLGKLTYQPLLTLWGICVDLSS